MIAVSTIFHDALPTLSQSITKLRNQIRIKLSPKAYGRSLKLEWQQTASELKKRYRQERNSERKMRLHAF